MSDRELLEMAAKAAGISLLWSSEDEVSPRLSDNRFWAWNPLTDDGDALRLAVALRFTIQAPSNDSDAALARDRIQNILAEVDGNIYESTRRAIVLAAAEIGKDMP